MHLKSYGLVGLIALTALAATPQSEVPPSHIELKQVMTTVADTGDPVRMSALQIEKSWSDSTIHLTGQVRLVVGKFSGSGSHALVITADEATFSERTGEVIPKGNVRITPYPSH